MKLSLILYAFPWSLRIKSWVFKAFRERLREQNLIVQMKVADDSMGRYFILKMAKSSLSAAFIAIQMFVLCLSQLRSVVIC